MRYEIKGYSVTRRFEADSTDDAVEKGRSVLAYDDQPSGLLFVLDDDRREIGRFKSRISPYASMGGPSTTMEFFPLPYFLK